ncbi:MAG: GspE/PulE family protein [Verrucomicrobiales bacterium]
MNALPVLDHSPPAGGPAPDFASSGGGGGAAGAAPAADQFPEGLVSIEGVAVQFGLLPVNLSRESCSVEAESLVRKLGRAPTTRDPWLPVSTLGPLIVFAHHRPKSDDIWGVPSCFGIRVVISSEQYEKMRKNLVMRLSSAPLQKSNPLEKLKARDLRDADLQRAFFWTLDHYPFAEAEKEKLETGYREEMDRAKGEILNLKAYNGFMPELGVALHYLIEGSTLLCFNALDAPRQNLFPAHLLEKHGVYPVHISDQRVYLLSSDDNCFAFEDEWLSLGNDPLNFVCVLGDQRRIRQVTSRRDSAISDTVRVDYSEDTLTHEQSENIIELVPEDILKINPENINHSPEELMHWLLFHSVNARASDIHVEQFYNVARFRARIDGRLKTIFTASLELLPRFIALVKNWSNMTQNRQDAQDARFSVMIGRYRVDVRVSAVPCRGEFQKLTLRLLDKRGGLKELSDLSLSKRQNLLIKRVMGRDQGLVLVTGPTGSGKTTTLYALINSVNEEHINIHTIEDPIEYEVEGVNQTQTDPAHNLSFATGLRALLRSDPDVILIGECRDEETANAAVSSALTGHLVLTTLHANDSLRAISRLLSMEVDPCVLADSLALTQAQRLVRSLCNYCKRPVDAPREVQERMYSQGIITGPLKGPVYIPVGCDECQQSGYHGRIALMELCEVNEGIADIVARGGGLADMRSAALNSGYRTLYQEGLYQVISGATTMEEIEKVSYTGV